MKFLKLLVLAAMVIGSAFVIGCNDSGSSDAEGDTGSLSLQLTDATTDDYQAVYVTIEEVQVHLGEADEEAVEAPGEEPGVEAADAENGVEEEDTGNDWKVVATPNKTYNLLDLVNGVMAELGTTELETGHYTQIRLMLGDSGDGTTNIKEEVHPYPNYIIDSEGVNHSLFVPSGYQTGIKLVHGFDMVAGKTVELVLDFDASKSIVKSGNKNAVVIDGKKESYLLKPTIKVIDTIDNAEVRGVVKDASGNPLEGALVSAQIYKDDATNEMDRVQVFTSTITAADDPSTTDKDEAGGYRMYLPPGSYKIVAYAETESLYGPSCKAVEEAYNDVNVYDFALEEKTAGRIVAGTTINVGDDDADAVVITISVRETSSCDPDAQIEVASLSLSGSYEDPIVINLPGTVEGAVYTVVATMESTIIDYSVELTEQVEVYAGQDTDVTFDFTAGENQ